jgi:hypothetical protein
LVSNHGLREEIDQLEAQMGTLQPGSPEYEFDRLQLAREELELKIREENPNLNPLTQNGAKALYQLMCQDPRFEEIEKATRFLCLANPEACTSWGIPMDS